MTKLNLTKTIISLLFIILLISLPKLAYSLVDCSTCDCEGELMSINAGIPDPSIYSSDTLIINSMTSSDELGLDCISCCQDTAIITDKTISYGTKIGDKEGPGPDPHIIPWTGQWMHTSINGISYSGPVQLGTVLRTLSTARISRDIQTFKGHITIEHIDIPGSARIVMDTDGDEAKMRFLGPNTIPGMYPSIEIGHDVSGGYFNIQDTATGSIVTGLSENGVVWEDTDSRSFMGDVGFGLLQDNMRALDTAFRVNYNGNALMRGFQMPTGASAGDVLTSDPLGNGTWQAPSSGGPGGGWERSGNHITLINPDDSVWIGGASSARFYVNGSIAGYHPTNSSIVTIGIQSYLSNTGSGRSFAGHFLTTSDGNGKHYGVYAHSSGSTTQDSISIGVKGSASSNSNTGEAYGGYFNAYANSGSTGNIYGIYASASGPGVNYAGYFSGNVFATGTITSGIGASKIDHPLDPENKYLMHSFIESPDMKNVYDGVAMLDQNGETIVQLPEYFEALNSDFRYQLTCIGGYAPVYIAEEISYNEFRIAGGTAGMKISWQVTGIRKDAFAEKYRIPVEVEKSYKERGLYLHPKAFDLNEEMGINYKEHSPVNEEMPEMDEHQ